MDKLSELIAKEKKANFLSYHQAMFALYAQSYGPKSSLSIRIAVLLAY
jgi:hypothetical protein